MSWGVYYTHKGYLSHLGKNELEEKREELQESIDNSWREILAYMASTPPVEAKDCEGSEYPFQEFIAFQVKRYQEQISEDERLIARIDDCLETMKEHPDDVIEG